MNDASTPVENGTSAAPSRASGSSFYTAMRILPRAQREAMFEIYSFCRLVDDVADSTAPHAERRPQLAEWRQRIEAIYAGTSAVRSAGARAGGRATSSSQKEDFLAVIDGMDMDAAEDIRAPDWAKLDLYCDRVASAVGRLSVRVFGMAENDGIALAHHLGRALQLTNILRDIDEDAEIGRLYLPAEELRKAGIDSTDPERTVLSQAPGLGQVCDAVARARARSFQGGRRDHGAQSAPRGQGAEDHGRGLSRHAARHDDARLGAAAHAGAGEPAAPVLDRGAIRNHLMARTVHIIGAGLAGLAAAVKLARAPAKIVVHEATAYPGGRCRSYFDRTIGMTIDNGNHLVLSGNHAVLDFAEAIGSAAALVGPATAEFPFVDLASGERWTLRINDGLPWWIFDKSRRVPGTRLGRLSAVARLLRVADDAAGRRRASTAPARFTTGCSIRCCWRP